MLQAILASKGFGMAKKYWQVIAGAVAVIAAFIFKRNYDSKIKKATIKEIETESAAEAAKQQLALDAASEAVLISHVSSPIPSDWAKLEQLSEKASPSAKAKAAANKIRKKLRRKD